jgi:hypothetical protein
MFKEPIINIIIVIAYDFIKRGTIIEKSYYVIITTYCSIIIQTVKGTYHIVPLNPIS